MPLLELRYNWRHGSILLDIYNIIKSQQGFEVFGDIEVYLNSPMITGGNQWPDFDIGEGDMMLLLELPVRF